MLSKRDQLLDETYRLFAFKGYELSLSDVCQVAGLKKQSIYNYFSSKEDLINAMLMREVEFYYDSLLAVMQRDASLSSLQRLENLIHFILDYFKDLNKLRVRRWVSLIQSEEALTEIKDIVSKHEIEFSKTLKEIMELGMQEGLIVQTDLNVISIYLSILIRGLIDGVVVGNMSSQYDAVTKMVIDEFWRQYTVDKTKQL